MEEGPAGKRRKNILNRRDSRYKNTGTNLHVQDLGYIFIIIHNYDDNTI